MDASICPFLDSSGEAERSAHLDYMQIQVTCLDHKSTLPNLTRMYASIYLYNKLYISLPEY